VQCGHIRAFYPSAQAVIFLMHRTVAMPVAVKLGRSVPMTIM
jgi:hypothetical protein